MLDSPRSPRVRQAAKLHQRTARSETGLFLVEGPAALAAAIAAKPEVLREVFVTEALRNREPDLIARAERVAEVVAVSERALAPLTDTVQPQGVVATARQFPQSLDAALEPATQVAILHEIRDPGNLGTILRVADAAGFDAVIVTKASVDPYNPKVVRSTAGSLFHVRHSVGVDTADAIAASQAKGLRVIAADVAGDDLRVAASSGVLAGPTAWLFGNEARGLDDATRALADLSLAVPVYGRAESMNLATAASVCMYATAFATR